MKMHTRHKAEPHVPFIALADIAWQIIIFFLIASTFARNDALKLDMPSTSGGKDAAQQSNITINVSQTELLIGETKIDMTELQSRLKEQLAGRTTDQDRIVLISPKDDLSFQRNTEVLHAVQKAGGIPVIATGGSQ